MVRAIDMHVHAPTEPGVPEPALDEAIRRYFKAPPPPSAEEMAETYRQLDLFGIIFTVDTETASGERPSSNDWVASLVRRWPDRFLGFCTVDPWKGEAAVREVERCVKELGLRGLKLHPVHQKFAPNDPRFYPLYKKCVELGIPVLFHSGFAAAGANLPGGGGLKLKYSAPIPYIDDVAAEFPELTIIMAHPGWPWVEEQIAVALHKANVYIDLSGWAPRYIPEALIREANTRLQDKVLFGSDYPLVRPERWLQEFEQLPIRDHIRPKILKENAKRALKLDID